MPVVINPFDTGGYSLAEMTRAINIYPPVPTVMEELGLFRPVRSVTQRTVLVEQRDGVLNVLPSVPIGAPPTVANRDVRSTRSFAIPGIKHVDVITPYDIQGVRGFGSGDSADPLAVVVEQRLLRARNKVALTREYMEVGAIRGVVKDGAGTTLYNYFTEFGITQKSVDFLFGGASTKIQTKVLEAVRIIEDNLLGETMTGVVALCGKTFFDNLTNHATVVDAYKYYASTGAQPLRDDARRNFPFMGIMFREYNRTVSLADGTTDKMIPDAEAYAFPVGTMDAFATYAAPVEHMDVVNTPGLPVYAWQEPLPRGAGVELNVQAAVLPVLQRPALSVKLYSSN